jgi:hypothetical protein
MAVNNGPEYRHQGSVWESLVGHLSRYDLVLTAIPLVLALAFVAYALLPIPFEVAVAGGAALSLAMVVDALFVHPPVDRR